MSIQGGTECAVRGCAGEIRGFHNLSRDHAVAGVGVKIGQSTMILTMWYAGRVSEYGTILLNDFALGDLFGGESGFKAMLESQGFEHVRLIATPQDLELTEDPLKHINQTLGEWAGRWQTFYPWQKRNGSASVKIASECAQFVIRAFVTRGDGRTSQMTQLSAARRRATCRRYQQEQIFLDF